MDKMIKALKYCLTEIPKLEEEMTYANHKITRAQAQAALSLLAELEENLQNSLNCLTHSYLFIFSNNVLTLKKKVK